jgi:predicted MPP superfamily phosphohydrolase
MEKITILNPTDQKDFKHKTSFPGAEGNPFDKILHFLDLINKIPTFIFIILVVLLAGILTTFNFEKWIILLVFTTFDLILIAFLPVTRISFGPYKSQVLILSILRSIFTWLPFQASLIFQILGTLLVIYGFYIEPSTVKISSQSLFLGKTTKQIRFIHIADIHLEKLGIRELKIKKFIQENPPEFILFTGDFLNLSNNQNSISIKQIIEYFNLLSSYAPTFYVSGSPAVDLALTVEAIESQLLATRINNAHHVLKINDLEINLIGLTCTHQPHKDSKYIPNLIKDDMINILLYHSPDLIFEIKQEFNINLMLSGHTHGGQVRFPLIGALFTGSLYGRKLQSGLYKIHDTLLSISRGIGLEGLGAPRVRFLCKPEITVWNLEQ